jgi:hypothetical protein
MDKKKLHGWKCNSEDHDFKTFIYSKYGDDDSHVELTCVTEIYKNPYPESFNVTYVGPVNEYIGVKPTTPNMLTTLLTNLYSELKKQ